MRLEQVYDNCGLLCAYFYSDPGEKEKVELISELKTERNGNSYYLKIFSNGFVDFGLYDPKGKWWSSRAECINSAFSLEGTEMELQEHICVALDNYSRGILKSKFEELDKKFDLRKKHSEGGWSADKSSVKSLVVFS